MLKILGNCKTRISTYLIDIYNFIIYGNRSIPKYRIAWIDPLKIKLSTKYFSKKSKGYLIGSEKDLDIKEIKKELRFFISSGNWDLNTTSINNVGVIIRSYNHFKNNLSWEEVGELDWMNSNIIIHGLQDDCRNIGDIILRCKRLDSLRKELEGGGYLLPQKKLNPLNLRETGGIGIAIRRDGEPIWIGGGAHRLAIAQFLKIKEVPVCLKLLHEEAVLNGNVFKKISKKNI